MNHGKEMAVLVVLALLPLWGGLCLAADEGQRAVTKETVLQWVEKYRDTQPEFQPGDVLTLSDLEKVRPFIPPGYFEEFNFPEVEFEIAPRGDYSPHRTFREATEKLSGQTRLAANGALEEYVAGQPFANENLDPQDPTSGLKTAWNFNFRWQHYGQRSESWHLILMRKGGTHDPPKGLPEDCLRGGGTIERMMSQRYQRVYFTHLAMLPEHRYTLPLPGAEQFEWKDYQEFIEPYELRGARIVAQRYADHHLADQAWEYVPSLRKVRRISVEEKSDSFLGTDTTLDDFYGFSGRVLSYDWKFYGWRDVLHVMNSRYSYIHHYGPDGRLSHDRWEVRKCAVVEQIPKDPRHPYSSKLLFWDAQTYRTTVALAFDREGKLWKIWYAQHSWSEEAQDQPVVNRGKFVPRFQGIVAIDLKSGQATLFPAFTVSYPDVTPEYIDSLFDLNKLTEGKR